MAIADTHIHSLSFPFSKTDTNHHKSSRQQRSGEDGNTSACALDLDRDRNGPIWLGHPRSRACQVTQSGNISGVKYSMQTIERGVLANLKLIFQCKDRKSH
ncbi:hypothetical protein TNIN_68891 [Trichonephila inaurata madagascariensis]|uniref:Uncharacterized protein n=1 Tax=Trichonephila inaurata madagascariensis TaxID=2747483 RepID=A0A8X7C6W4_9ARAC|nr:hypothetical protein TNIN_68891 [Trichonephila inaurata madagascariensis]